MLKILQNYADSAKRPAPLASVPRGWNSSFSFFYCLIWERESDRQPASTTKSVRWGLLLLIPFTFTLCYLLCFYFIPTFVYDSFSFHQNESKPFKFSYLLKWIRFVINSYFLAQSITWFLRRFKMGVRGLQTYLEQYCPSACYKVNLASLISEYR